MKNGLDNVDDEAQLPPSKRIKLEEDPNAEERLLSRKRLGRSGRRKLVKSTIEERALILLNDDRISAVEPQQVLCRMCGHWVKLFKHTDYSPANWRTHADKCEPRSGWKSRIQADPGAVFTLTIPASHKSAQTVPAAESVSASLAPAASSSTAVSSEIAKRPCNDSVYEEYAKLVADPSPARRPTKSTVDRRRELEKDSRCEKPGPHSVHCKMCGQSVRLHNTREYDLWNWLRHAEKCEVKNGWVKLDSSTSQAPDRSSELPGELTSSTDSRPIANQAGPTRESNSPRASPCVLIPADIISILMRKRLPDSTPNPVSTTVLNGNESANCRRRRVDSSSDSGSALIHVGQEVHRATAPTPAVDCSDELRSISEIRIEEVQTERRDLVIGEPKYTANVPASSLAGVEMQPSASSSTIPFIKAEPNDLDELLFSTRQPAVDEEGASASTGAKRRKGRSAEERRQALLGDSRIGKVLPNEVFCNMCNKWIKLYKEVEYVESNWTRHAERCSLRFAAKNVAKISEPTNPAAMSSSTTSSPTKRSPVKSTAERLGDLRADPRIEAIEPHQVLCGICKQWIKLQSYREYDIWNWRKHIPLCEQRHSGTGEGLSRLLTRVQSQVSFPSEPNRSSRTIKAEEVEAQPSASAVAGHLTAPSKLSSSVKVKDESSADERRAILERDGRCENIESQRVTCKMCNRVVGLHVKKDYSLSNWYKHVASCGKAGKAAKPSTKTTSATVGLSRPVIISVGAEASSSAQALAPAISKDRTIVLADDPAPIQDADVQLVVSAPPHTSRAPKSTAEDRRAKLHADPRVAVVEPNRIKCKLCQHWLKLNEFMEYAPYNWYKHIERCESRTSMKDQSTSNMPLVVKKEKTETQEVKLPKELSVSADGGSRKRTTPAERLARMQADSRIKTIEKHRARCGLCDKWVKLQNKTEYDPHNWFAHVKKCAIRSNASPGLQPLLELEVDKQEASPTINDDSDSASCFVETIGVPGIITALTRRAVLLNDPRSAVVEAHRVLCGICHQWIKLRDGKDYVPYNWFKHKRKCEKRHGLPQASIPPNDDVTSASAFPKEVVKKEPVSVNLGLYNTDQRKMTDDEREAQLRADPRLGDVEPGRVFCKMCDSWIKLNMSTGFLRGNWLRHAQRCKGRPSWQGATPETTEEPPELSAFEIIDLETSTESHFGYIELGRLIGKFEPSVSSTEYGIPTEVKPAPDVVKQPPTWSMPTLRARPNNSRVNSPVPLPQSQNESKVSETGKRMHRSEEARKQELESDPRTKVVHPDKILCRMCDRWIQMRRDVSYSPQNWLKHAGICEQRTGWLKKHKPETQVDVKTAQHYSQTGSEEFIPYNARVRIEEQQVDFDPPSLKPVDWGQIVSSDDDDDDLVTVVNVPVAKSDTIASSTKSALNHQVLSNLKAGSETSNSNGALNTTNAQIMSVPTPMAAFRANHADLKAFPISLSTPMGARKPTSTSPPMVAPFTTVPLPFYRAAYAPHVMQSGFSPARDGAPPKSASPQNGGAQRALPFVVPAPSMLPHLLPRPVLVPISQTSRQTTGVVSPFRFPSTSPVPPVGLTKSNGTLPTPPLAAPTMVDNRRSTTASSEGSPANSALVRAVPSQTVEASGVAVPTPVRSLPGPSTLPMSVESDRMSSSPANRVESPQTLVHGPRSIGVLQLAPSSEVPHDKMKTENVVKSVQVGPGVLHLGPRSDMPPPKEKMVPERGATVTQGLQLGPRTDMPLEKKPKPERTALSAPPVKPNPGVLQLAPVAQVRQKEETRITAQGTTEVIHLAPNFETSPGREVNTQRDIAMSGERLEAVTSDVTEQPQDAMLVEA